MFLAFSWWAVLLYTKNKDAFEAKANFMRLGMMVEKQFESEALFLENPKYLALKKKYDTQQKMILGEGMVFTISLIIGIWLIMNSSKKELDAAKARKNFLLSISHELKSPLASIKLTFDTLLKRNLDKNMVDKFSLIALKETERLERLVNDLLLATRLETIYTSTFEPVDIVEITKNTYHSFKSQYPNIQIEFDCQIPKLVLNIDKIGFISILNNLIENAIKYSVDQPIIHINLNSNNNKIDLIVEDQGVGISESDKKHIFNRFFRSGNEETRNTKGTGLGLYIVKQMAKIHKAEVSVKDNHPKGSIFCVTFPKE